MLPCNQPSPAADLVLPCSRGFGLISDGALELAAALVQTSVFVYLNFPNPGIVRIETDWPREWVSPRSRGQRYSTLLTSDLQAWTNNRPQPSLMRIPPAWTADPGLAAQMGAAASVLPLSQLRINDFLLASTRLHNAMEDWM